MAKAFLMIVGCAFVAVLALLSVIYIGKLMFGGGQSGDDIVQQRYEQCISAGGTFRHGDGWDNWSCTINQ